MPIAIAITSPARAHPSRRLSPRVERQRNWRLRCSPVRPEPNSGWHFLPNFSGGVPPVAFFDFFRMGRISAHPSPGIESLIIRTDFSLRDAPTKSSGLAFLDGVKTAGTTPDSPTDAKKHRPKKEHAVAPVGWRLLKLGPRNNPTPHRIMTGWHPSRDH